jgi:DNA polymerase-3 subunit alpha
MDASDRLPAFDVPDGIEGLGLLRQAGTRGLRERLRHYEAAAMDYDADAYAARLEEELQQVAALAVVDYFLILRDVAGWLRTSGIHRGPGSGSAPSSLLLWTLDVTDVDPIRFGLITERFLNSELTTPPQVTFYLPPHRWREPLDYLRRRYGDSHVAEVETAPKLLEMYRQDGWPAPLKLLVRREPFPTSTLGHADAPREPSLEFRGSHHVARLGTAGLLAPSTIAMLSLEDKAMYELVVASDLEDVCQLETPFLRQLVGRLRPRRFEDLVAITTLDRPQPVEAGLTDHFIRRCHGEAWSAPHPVFEPILADTHGIFVYQEQVMRAASAVTRCSMTRADTFRRKISRRKSELHQGERTFFLAAALDCGFDARESEELFGEVKQAAAGAFNRSHAVAFGLLTYLTALLKLRGR